MFDNIDNEPRQVTIGQPLVYRRRQQVIGLAIHRDEAAHGDLLSSAMTVVSISRCNGKTDRLLVSKIRESGTIRQWR